MQVKLRSEARYSLSTISLLYGLCIFQFRYCTYYLKFQFIYNLYNYKIMYFVRENSNLRESGREEKQQIEEREENL